MYKNVSWCLKFLIDFLSSSTAFDVVQTTNGARNGMGMPNSYTCNSLSGNLRGSRGSNLQNPRSPTPMSSSQSQNYYRPIQSPLSVGFTGPRPYRAPSFSPVLVQYPTANIQTEYLCNTTIPLQPPSPFELAPRYEYVGVPLEPPSQSYVIYDDGDESALSTAEIIERQSQDYVDEQLAQFEMMTIAKLQGK